MGAVVLGPDGAVIAEGRNRAAGTEALPGQVVGAAIAHAEVNALAVVPRGTPGITLLSTLGPAPRARRRPAPPRPPGSATPRPTRCGRASSASWGRGLALLSVVRWIAGRTGRSAAEELADGSVATTIRAHQPAVAALAEALMTADLRPDPDLSPERGLARWWPAVEDAGRRG